jgi:hypothetical protein
MPAEERKWVIESYGHEFTWVPPALRTLPDRSVALAGGAMGECLADMESVLDHLGIKFNRLSGVVF